MSDAAQYSSSSELAVLCAADVWKSYDNGSIKVLNGVDFHAHAGRTVALCGPSGCGAKSTLLHLLGGLDEPDRGSISLNGAPLPAQSQFIAAAVLSSRLCLPAAQSSCGSDPRRELSYSHRRRRD